MLGKYSPTVSGWYALDQQWWRKNCNPSEFNIYDKDGYDSYGYDTENRDRAGIHEREYAFDHNLYNTLYNVWWNKDTPIYAIGWTVSHPQYGKWFLSRDAVIADWKQDQAQAYPDEQPREPTDAEVETWYNEQTSWVEVAANGKQIERPDMAAYETAWLLKMADDADCCLMG